MIRYAKLLRGLTVCSLGVYSHPASLRRIVTGCCPGDVSSGRGSQLVLPVQHFPLVEVYENFYFCRKQNRSCYGMGTCNDLLKLSQRESVGMSQHKVRRKGDWQKKVLGVAFAATKGTWLRVWFSSTRKLGHVFRHSSLQNSSTVAA